MAKFNVPGIKNSTGMKGFPVLPAGEYKLTCTKCEVLPPKNPAPVDVWTFMWDIIEGPPMADGKATKGQRYSSRIQILHENHPDYETRGEMGVDELKSLIMAAGVTFKGEDVNPDAFHGTTVFAKIVQTPSKTNPDQIFNNVRDWKSA